MLIRGADIVTMDAALGDLPSADILIEDGAIRAVGPSLAEAGDTERIDGAGMIALPGIIDAHTCLWQTVLRGHVPDLWLGTYNTKLLPLRQRYSAEDNFNAAYVGAFEMLSYGTTTVVDYCHNSRSPDFAPASIEALKTTGIRHLYTYSFMTARPDEFPAAARFDDARRVYDTFHDPAGLTTIGFGVDSIGAPALEKQLSFARALRAPSCIHVNETGTIEQLHARGLLGPDLLVIHGNLITNGDLELMAKARVPICFTPTADTQGTPADVVRRAIDRGVDVVFGCDIPCSIASDTIGQLRVMFNVQGFLDGAMERSFSNVVGRRPPVRPGVPLLTPRRDERGNCPRGCAAS
jgi:cytosine/adenosine deaminase-related metal-dependent hydrolase